jgi:hypothetical protein
MKCVYIDYFLIWQEGTFSRHNLRNLFMRRRLSLGMRPPTQIP